VEKAREWQNVVKKELLFNVVKSVKKFLTVISISVKKIVMQALVNRARKKKWPVAIAVKELI
jgi:hypothetical protein